jgi:hypothetical protein
MNERIGWRTPEPLLATELEDDAAPPRRVVAPGKRTLTEGLRRAEDVPSVVPGRDGAAARAAGPRPLAARGTSPMAIVDPFDFLDEAAARADAARAVVADAARDLGVTPTIHVGEAARAATEGHRATTRGLALGDAIYLHPEVDVANEDGRRIALHEVVHLAQARLDNASSTDRASAEAEADELSRRAARGARLEAPRQGLALTRAAADDDVKVAPASLAYELKGQLINRWTWAVKVKRQSQTAVAQGVKGDDARLKHASIDTTLQARLTERSMALKNELLSLEGSLKIVDGLRLSVKVSGLEASLSTSGALDVKLIKLTFVATGTDLPWLRDLFPPQAVIELKLQGEVTPPSDLLEKVAKDLASIEKARVDLHKVLDEQTEVLEKLDERKRRFQVAEQELAERRRAAKRAKGAMKKAENQAAQAVERRLKAEKDEIRKLARQLTHLEQARRQAARGVRGSAPRRADPDRANGRQGHEQSAGVAHGEGRLQGTADHRLDLNGEGPVRHRQGTVAPVQARQRGDGAGRRRQAERRRGRRHGGGQRCGRCRRGRRARGRRPHDRQR